MRNQRSRVGTLSKRLGCGPPCSPYDAKIMESVQFCTIALPCNHHAAPQSARHGLAWYEFDLNWYGIMALRRLCLAWDIKLPRLRVMKFRTPTPQTDKMLEESSERRQPN